MRNKGFIGLLGILLVFVGCQSEKGYEVRGRFAGAPEGATVYLADDSTKIVNGEFVFRGKVEVPELRSLKVNALNKYGYPAFKGTLLWINNEKLEVECPWDQLTSVFGYTDKMKVSGSELNDVYREYQKQAAAIGASRDSLWKVYQEVYLTPLFEGGAVDGAASREVMRQIREIAARKRRLAQEFIAAHPTSPASVDVLTWQLTGQNYSNSEALNMIYSLDTTLKAIPAYSDMLKAYNEFSPTAKGEKYMDVELTDRKGKTVKLSDVIVPGKYNMLEFWASWCGPCRGEIPHLRHVHEVLGDDFNIISISIDEKEADWKKAMKEEAMVWTQLRDAQGWKGGACQAYRVNGVPYCLLLDGDGNIIGGDLRGAELDLVLTELLGEKAAKL